MTRTSVALLAAAAVCSGAYLMWTAGAASADREPAPGAIVGVVTFSGEAPARTPLDRRSDPACAKVARLSEDVVVTDGKLRDVHVRLPNGSAGTHAAPSAPAEVNQSQCMYEPRVIGIVEGQKVVVKNSDPTYHNVRGARAGRTRFNLGQPAGAAPIVRDNLGKAGEIVSLHCDIHRWMQAWAVVSDHPYFDVTGADGAFRIEGVPPGTYTLEAWHPKLGARTAKVTVRPGKTAKARFAYE